MPSRSTLPLPSGQPSPSASRLARTYSRLRRVKSSISSRNPSSPVQRQISATALGNLTISSVLKSGLPSVNVPLPCQTEPSATTSCTTTPEPSLSTSDTSRSARMWFLIDSNCPSVTFACAVYSPSVANSHG